MDPSLTRVAVVQIAYHPAILVDEQSPLADPGGLDVLLPEATAVPKDVRPKFESLRLRIRDAYTVQILLRVRAILDACRAWNVQVVVFPEYSIPWDILDRVAASAGDLVIIAGTHMVETSPGCLVVYERVGWPKDSVPTYGQAVAPVLHQGRLIGLSPKFHPAVAVGEEIEPGKTWAPVAMPEGIAGPMGVMVCLDFLYRENPEHRALVAGPLEGCRFLAVPSLTRRPSVLQFAEKAWEEAKRYGRPVLFANGSEGGGTAIFVDEEKRSDLRPFPRQPGCFEAGEEGVIVADVDLGFRRPGGSTRYGEVRPVKPFAAASMVYRFHLDGDAYAAWLDGCAALLARDDKEARDTLVARIGEALAVLGRAGDQPDAQARRERLDRLAENRERLLHVEKIRQLTREVIVPPEVLPFDVLQATLAGAAAEAAQEWLGTHPELGGVVKRLREAGEVGRALAGAGHEAVGTVMAAVVGRPEGAATLPALVPLVVLPPGIHPAALGIRRHEGLVLNFRSHPSDFRTHEALEEPGHELSETYLQEAEELWLLATAEGATSISTLGVWMESAVAGDLFLLSSMDGAWVLWTSAVDRWIDAKKDMLLAAMRESGLPGASIEVLGRADRKDRARLLLGRFAEAQSVIDRRLAERLADVGGQFVEPVARVNDHISEPVLSALDHWLASTDQTALLLGEFGSGKSTVLARWAASRWLGCNEPKAILVNLAGVATGTEALRQLLDASGADDTPTNRAALELLIRRRLLVPCFDGFDEMATRVGLADLRGQMETLLRVAKGGGQVVMSCRDNYFPTEQTMNTTAASALASALGKSAGVRRVKVELFNPSRVEELVKKVLPGEAADDALARIRQAYDLVDLVTRPLLLGMVLRSLDKLPKDARVGTADVYEAYLAQWLEHTHSGDPEGFTDEQKCAFAEALAEQLWRSGRQAQPWQDLQESVRERLYRSLPRTMHFEAAFLEIQGGAFFVHEGEDKYRFAHKSMLEYFLARALAKTLLARPAEALTTKRLTPEVAAFLGEVLKRKGDPKTAAAVQAVQRWLVNGRGPYIEGTAVAAANALRLLLGLARWAKDRAGWIPELADLRAVNMERESLRGVALVAALLEGALLAGADLSDADLRGARLDTAKLTGATLDRAVLVEASARHADFTHVSAHGADLTAADLSDARFGCSTWSGCTWAKANLDGARVTGWIAPGSDHSAVNRSSVRIIHTRATVSSGPMTRATAAAWNEDRSRVAVGSQDGFVRVWDMMSRRALLQIDADVGAVTALAWGSDKLAVGGARGVARVFSAQSGAGILVCGEREGAVRALAWSPSSTHLACARDREPVTVWDLASFGRPTRVLPREGVVNVLAWSLSRDRLATGHDDGSVWIWDVGTVETKTPSRGARHRGAVRTLAWSPDGQRLASAGDDAEIHVWDAEGAREAAPRRGHRGAVVALAWRAASTHLASACSDGTVRVWDLQREEEEVLSHFDTLRITSNWNTFVSAAWSNNEAQIFTVNTLGSVYAWSAVEGGGLAGGREMNPLHWKMLGISSISWSRDGARLACVGRAGSFIVSTATGEIVQELFGETVNTPHAVAWHPSEDRVIVGGDSGSLALIDLRRNVTASTFQMHDGPVQAIAWHPRGGVFVSVGDDGTLRLWDEDSAPEILRAGVVTYTHPDGRKEEGAQAPIRRSKVTEAHRSGATAVCFHPDGDLVASAGKDGKVRVWQLSAMRASRIAGPPSLENKTQVLDARRSGHLCAMGWNADGTYLAACDRTGRVWIWGGRTGVPLRELEQGGQVIAWHPREDDLASVGNDGALRVWNVRSGELVRRIELDVGAVSVLAWNPDGRRAAVAGADGWIRIVDVLRGILLAEITCSTRHSLARTPSGFCSFGGGGADECQLALRRPEPSSRTALYLPLAGLRDVLQRPDKVAAALAGDLSGDDLGAELARLGWDNGVPWNGEEHRVPPTQDPLPAQQGPKTS